MRKRKLLFCTARQSGDPSDLAFYHRQRSRVISLLRESKQKFFNNLASADSKHFWKSVKALNCKRNIAAVTLSDGTVTADTSFGKAVLLNNFFFGCFNHQYPALCASTLPAFHVLDNIDPTNFPTDLLCSIDFVTELLVKLDASKSSGLDGIASKMLKMTASLQVLQNFSIYL